MTTQLVVVPIVVVAATVVALLARRRTPDPPANPADYLAPAQLDRRDFPRPESPWLVVVFTSVACGSCGDTWAKASMLDGPTVAAVEVEASAQPDLHSRYKVDAVPITVVADDEGIVRRSWVGPVSATHLWAGVAELREPGAVPPGCSAGDQADGASPPSSPA